MTVSRKLNRLIVAGAAALTLGVAIPAHASLVLDETLFFSAQGFGNVPRHLTLSGPDPESGCVGVAAGGGITFGASACITNAQVFGSNGVQNIGGDEDNPLAINQKHGIPTLTSLGWSSASNIALLFNATESAGNLVTIDDITLKFYNPVTGALIMAIDGGGVVIDLSQQGNGSAGFAFVVDAAQQIALNNTVFNQAGYGDFRIALETTVSDVNGGAESWTAVSRAAVPEPSTWALMLLGFGMIGFGLRSRRATKTTVSFA